VSNQKAGGFEVSKSKTIGAPAAHFLAKGDKTAVTVMHGKLPDAKAAEKMKRYWGAQLDALAEHLGTVRP
jgi:hypothetical protein